MFDYCMGPRLWIAISCKTWPLVRRASLGSAGPTVSYEERRNFAHSCHHVCSGSMSPALTLNGVYAIGISWFCLCISLLYIYLNLEKTFSNFYLYMPFSGIWYL